MNKTKPHLFFPLSFQCNDGNKGIILRLVLLFLPQLTLGVIRGSVEELEGNNGTTAHRTAGLAGWHTSPLSKAGAGASETWDHEVPRQVNTVYRQRHRPQHDDVQSEVPPL